MAGNFISRECSKISESGLTCHGGGGQELQATVTGRRRAGGAFRFSKPGRLEKISRPRGRGEHETTKKMMTRTP